MPTASQRQMLRAGGMPLRLNSLSRDRSEFHRSADAGFAGFLLFFTPTLTRAMFIRSADPMIYFASRKSKKKSAKPAKLANLLGCSGFSVQVFPPDENQKPAKPASYSADVSSKNPMCVWTRFMQA